MAAGDPIPRKGVFYCTAGSTASEAVIPLRNADFSDKLASMPPILHLGVAPSVEAGSYLTHVCPQSIYEDGRAPASGCHQHVDLRAVPLITAEQ